MNKFQGIANSVLRRLNVLKTVKTDKFLILARHWFGFDYGSIFRMALKDKLIFVEYDCPDGKNDVTADLAQEDYKRIEYKGVSLYQAAIYTICNDLEVMPQLLNLTIKRHREVVAHWYQATVRNIDYATRMFDEHSFSKTIIPQGYVLEASIIRQIAIKRGIKVIAIENSFRKDRLLWDDVSGITVNANLSGNYFRRLKSLVSDAEVVEYARQFLENIKNLKADEHSSPKTIYRKKTERKTVLFLGQVYLDSSLIFGLHDFVDTVELVEALCRYCEQLGYLLIVKLHPKELGGNNMVGKPLQKITWRKIMVNDYLARRVRDPNLLFIDHQNSYDTYSLMANADVCVTVNSMSGLEALLLGKNVILCGRCSYGGLGFTFDSLNKEMLTSFLNLVLQQGASLAKGLDVYKFFYIYLEKYCIEKSAASFLGLVKSR